MSRSQTRTDKTCLNCRHVVENRFCPNCGQENIDTRKSFYHLFVHFFEDLTHYENAFWRTIKNLIIRPASLTKEYLSGKRMSYLAPVRLYIFISFVTFLIIGMETTESEASENKTATARSEKIIKDRASNKGQKQITSLEEQGILSKTEADSARIAFIKVKKDIDNGKWLDLGDNDVSVNKLDSVQNFGNPKDKLPALGYWFIRKMLVIQEKFTKQEIKEKFTESFLHNLPKVLFIYMPIFAVVLWLFHNKKRWYYFDHGIFTLHYFSFLLLAILIYKLEDYLLSFVVHYGFFNFIDSVLKFIIILYMIYYILPAHHRFYNNSRLKSFFKVAFMSVINIFLVTIILGAFIIYTLINLH
ncbi:MAG TPA: DUF3667 domain-containing protein [Flavobacterium sp.]|jgi:hypothetical protein